MDNVLVLAKTRGQLRRTVCIRNQTFAELKVKQHPDKTYIGRIGGGFVSALRYHVHLDCCGV